MGRGGGRQGRSHGGVRAHRRCDAHAARGSRGDAIYEDVAELLEHLDESPLGEPVTNQSGDRWDERIPRRSDMPDVDEDDDRETDGDQSAPEDHLTGEKQAAINRENEPPA